MKLRRRVLPEGWYPGSKSEIERMVSEWNTMYPVHKYGIGGIVPHAGWFFSGKLAYGVIQSIDSRCSTVVVIGGHLAGHDSIYAAEEDAFETPLGPLTADTELLKQLKEKIEIKSDVTPDNTVEIQLPLVRYRWTDMKVVYMRAPPSGKAEELGRLLGELNRQRQGTIAVLGSTDLTHYGPSYRFSPAGSGRAAVEWVKKENDKPMVEAMVNMESSRIIELAHESRSACSAGAAAAAAAFAAQFYNTKGIVIDYYTSADIMKSGSFVGYAGVLYTSDKSVDSPPDTV